MTKLAAIVASDSRHRFREHTHCGCLLEGISIGPVFFVREVSQNLQSRVWIGNYSTLEMVHVAVWALRTESNHVIRAYFNAMSEIMNELTVDPVQLAKSALVVGAWLLLSLDASVPRCGSSWCHCIPSNMLESTLVSLVASAIFLEEAARRYLVRVVDMKEFTVISLFALVRKPMHADCPLSLAFIYSLILWFQNCIELVPASYLNRPLTGGASIHVIICHGHVSICGWPRRPLMITHHWHHTLIIGAKVVIVAHWHD